MKRKAAYTLCCKSLLAILLFLVCSQSAFTQAITNYTFASSVGTFTGATSTALATGNTDDGSLNTLPVEFEYWYMGVRYTIISISTNGWLSPGSTITDDNTNDLSARISVQQWNIHCQLLCETACDFQKSIYYK